MPGFEAKFVTPLLKRHECPICLYAMKNPVQTECGHLFCRECLEPVLRRRRPICPLDKEEITQEGIFPDNACRREILNLEVYCNNMAGGCTWKGHLKHLEEHLQSCEYRELQCTQCDQYIQSLLLKTHQEVNCPMRPETCPHCHEDIPSQQMQDHILKACPDVLHQCPNGCSPKLEFKLKDLEHHLAENGGDCPLTEMKCPFVTYGCTFVSLRENLSTHMEQYQIYHAQIQAEGFSELKASLDKYTSSLQHLMERTTSLESRTNAVERLQDAIEQRVELLDERRERHMDRYDSKLENLEEQTARLNTNVTQIQRRMEEIQVGGASYGSGASHLITVHSGYVTDYQQQPSSLPVGGHLSTVSLQYNQLPRNLLEGPSADTSTNSRPTILFDNSSEDSENIQKVSELPSRIKNSLSHLVKTEDYRKVEQAFNHQFEILPEGREAIFYHFDKEICWSDINDAYDVLGFLKQLSAIIGTELSDEIELVEEFIMGLQQQLAPADVRMFQEYTSPMGSAIKNFSANRSPSPPSPQGDPGYSYALVEPESGGHGANYQTAPSSLPVGASPVTVTPQRIEQLTAQLVEVEHGVDRALSQCVDQELRVQLIERSTYNGVLIWKIDDFERRRKEAIDGVTMSLYSTPFYTSRHGYKMCARVYLNGDGIGKGSHLSFFFVIMRGPYDAMLQWPFKQKVSLTLINQGGRRNVNDNFRPDPTSSSFQRPGRREMNIASGCPMFCRIDQLLSGGFVKDDSIWVRVVVDTSDLPKYP